jgi:monolysocardiolipin acyltransferase
MFFPKKRSQRACFLSMHPAHQGNRELCFWRPDKKWYHPLLCRSVVELSKLVLGKFNTLSFEKKEYWEELFVGNNKSWSRSDGRGLLSFSNHVSLFDDPLLISNLGIAKFDDIRWVAADHKNFFGNNLKGLIYSGGKCVPIIRGMGLEQPGFEFLIERLKCGDWVHIFPEGGRSREQESHLQLPLKIGIGKLIYETNPVIVPFYHYGMHDVLPIGSIWPRREKYITVRFGKSQIIDHEWWLKCLGTGADKVEPQYAWQRATEKIEQILLDLEQQVHPFTSNRKVL